MLVTGFEGYGGRGLNPAEEVVKALDGTGIAGVRVSGAILPVSYAGLEGRLAGLLAEPRRLVICLGLWPGEAMIRLERFALNYNDFEIADNAGVLEHGAIEPGEPLALPATLPLGRIEERLLAAGIPARLSSSAGNFLCNALMFRTLRLLRSQPRPVPAGFIHLPYLPAQVAELVAALKAERRTELHQRGDLSSMALETMVEAVRIAIATTLEAGPGAA